MGRFDPGPREDTGAHLVAGASSSQVRGGGGFRGHFPRKKASAGGT